MTGRTFDIVRGTVLLVVALGFIGWFLVRCLKRSDDPARLIFKWILTVPVVGAMLFWVGPLATQSQGGAFIGVPLLAACGLVLTAIWRHAIADLIAKPFTSLYDGGSEPPTPKPAYSMAQAKQKKGEYLEAVAKIREQLGRFPTHGHAPQNIVFALYSMADWHLQIGRDREAAQRNLQKIIDLFPESEFALGAAHRIAHLGSAEMLLAPEDRRKFIVTEGVRNVGLLHDWGHLKPAEASPEQLAADYVKHLEQHPLDTEAREKLAVIYADHYGRLDMAAGELEQMIGQPNQPGRLVVHWLNLLADLQIRHGASDEAVRETLQRIVDRDPKAAPAEIARNRLARLRLEMKSKDDTQAVKLGSYEQNIGLKRGLPRR
jgi:tetratricopeptide (TPR) repeat protein